MGEAHCGDARTARESSATATVTPTGSSTTLTAGSGTVAGTRASRASCTASPTEDANLVVLCNVETWAGELRDAVLETWRQL